MRRVASRIGAVGSAAVDFEDYIEQPLPGSAILRIITRGDDEFETLTGAAGWAEPLA